MAESLHHSISDLLPASAVVRRAGIPFHQFCLSQCKRATSEEDLRSVEGNIVKKFS